MPSLSPALRAELAPLIARSRGAVFGIALLSAALNVILLAGSIYMMLVYDYVLPAHSVPTLVGLFAMVAVAYGFQAGLDLIRARLLLQLSATLEHALSGRVHRLIGALARARPGGDALQPMRDLDQVRGFLSGAGPTALLDLPWMAFFILVLFLLHPWLGVTVLVGAAVLIGLTILTDRLSTAPLERLNASAGARHLVADASRRHAETLRALGMEGRIGAAWMQLGRRHQAAQARMAGVTGTLGGLSKIFRLLLQSTVLSVGALLVMGGHATGGVIFASSILSSRALAPVELAIANWRGFLAARQSWARLAALLSALPAEAARHALPAPRESLAVEGLTLIPAGGDRPVVHNVSIRAQAGEAIAVIGASGSGKSTLARALVGALAPVAGKVRLDGAALDQWEPVALGRHLGYLSQSVELLSGTVAHNIARFDPHASPEAIVAAAQLAGVHDLILRLPDGYGAQVGSDGNTLSAGQRQRIALARALYGDPFLVVLDEPNSNLDEAGEKALAAAVRAVCARGGIVIVVAHRAAILDAVHKVMVMQDGAVQAFGPKEAIIPDRRRARRIPPAPSAEAAAPAQAAA